MNVLKTLFDLPSALVHQIVNEWLPLNSVGKLDSVTWGTNQRQDFLQLLEYVFTSNLHLPSNSQLDVTSYMKWVVNRNVRPACMHFPPWTHHKLSQRLLTSFLRQTRSHLRQITSDFDEEKDFQEVYLRIQSACGKLERLTINHSTSARFAWSVVSSCQSTIRELVLRADILGYDDTFVDNIYCPNMRFLEFHGRCFVPRFLARLLEGSPNLVELHFAGASESRSRCSPAASEGLSFISAMARSYPHLRVLDVSETAITDVGLASLASRCPNLTTFRASQCTALTDAGVIALTTHCKNIQEMRINGNHALTDQAMAAIAGAYPTSLTALDVCDCYSISAEGIASVTRQCKLLQCLHLHDTVQLYMAVQEPKCIKRCGALQDLAVENELFPDEVVVRPQ